LDVKTGKCAGGKPGFRAMLLQKAGRQMEAVSIYVVQSQVSAGTWLADPNGLIPEIFFSAPRFACFKW